MIRSSLAIATLALVSSFSPAVARVERAPHSAAQDQEKKETEGERKLRKSRKLLHDNGTREVSQRAVDKMLSAFKKMPLPEGFIDAFKDKLDIDAMLELSVVVYAEKLDESTIDALLTFYGTAEGRKFAEQMPDLTDEAMQKGMEYGQKLAQDVLHDLGK